MQQGRHIFARPIVIVLSTASAILCLTTVAVWIESYRRGSGITMTATAPAAGWSWSSAQGHIIGTRYDPPVPLAELTAETPDRMVSATTGEAYGFSAGSRLHGPSGDRLLGLYSEMRGVLFTGTTGSRFYAVGIRYRAVFWISAIGALPAVVAWGRYRIRRRLLRVGLCSNCGYDLRASPDRCPECGTRVAMATTGSDQ